MSPLSRDEILAVEDLETREVKVPEWGGTVFVKALSGTERDAFEASCRQIRGREVVPLLTNIRAKLVARCVVDEHGDRLFADNDINALGRKSAAALDRLFDIASEMSGISNTAVEEMAQNLEPVQSDGSTSL